MKASNVKVDFLETAKEHRAADASCGRPWTCGCVACLNLKDAAPALLSSLKEYVEGYDGTRAERDERARAIIAKAEGNETASMDAKSLSGV